MKMMVIKVLTLTLCQGTVWCWCCNDILPRFPPPSLFVDNLSEPRLGILKLFTALRLELRCNKRPFFFKLGGSAPSSRTVPRWDWEEIWRDMLPRDGRSKETLVSESSTVIWCAEFGARRPSIGDVDLISGLTRGIMKPVQIVRFVKQSLNTVLGLKSNYQLSSSQSTTTSNFRGSENDQWHNSKT